jgi:hypothetical protein
MAGMVRARSGFGVLSLCLLLRGTAAADADAPGPAAAAAGSQAAQQNAGGRWRIRPGAVGPIEVGKRIPKEMLTQDLEKRYVARHIDDAQPFEGFRYDDPPITVGIAKGPFMAWDARHGLDDPPMEQLRKKAAKAARGGAKVKSIWVEAAGPTTEAGIGVGSTIDALRQAYRDLAISRIPENQCIATSRSLPGIVFRLDPCGKGGTGQVVKRVDL